MRIRLDPLKTKDEHYGNRRLTIDNGICTVGRARCGLHLVRINGILDESARNGRQLVPEIGMLQLLGLMMLQTPPQMRISHPDGVHHVQEVLRVHRQHMSRTQHSPFEK